MYTHDKEEKDMLNKISRKMTSGLIKYVKDVRYDEEVYVYGF